MHSAWYVNIVLSVLLQALLFCRAYVCGLSRRYPFFYTYLAYTALWTFAFSLPVFIRDPSYPTAYWLSYVLAALLRFGIAAEIHRYVFPLHSSLRTRANVAVLLALTLLAFIFWIAGPGPGPSVFPDALRKITLSVATWIFVVLGLARYYGIRVGRNVWGIAAGVLLFTGSELIYLAAMDLLPRLWAAWRYIHPLTFVLTLIVWASALWRYHPNPVIPSLDKSLKQDLLNAWRDRWTTVPALVRKVVKS